MSLSANDTAEILQLYSRYSTAIDTGDCAGFANCFVPNGIFDNGRALQLLDDLNLADKANAWAEDLSGGEQQRVAIARALVHTPNLILADEPTGNLDVETGREIIRLIDDLVRREGKTLIMATHSQEVIGYADRVLTIRDRKLVER